MAMTSSNSAIVVLQAGRHTAMAGALAYAYLFQHLLAVFSVTAFVSLALAMVPEDPDMGR
jgi:hypothetical protein